MTAKTKTTPIYGQPNIPDAPNAFCNGSEYITLAWDPPYDGGSPITGYDIYRSATIQERFEIIQTNLSKVMLCVLR